MGIDGTREGDEWAADDGEPLETEENLKTAQSRRCKVMSRYIY